MLRIVIDVPDDTSTQFLKNATAPATNAVSAELPHWRGIQACDDNQMQVLWEWYPDCTWNWQLDGTRLIAQVFGTDTQ